MLQPALGGCVGRCEARWKPLHINSIMPDFSQQCATCGEPGSGKTLHPTPGGMRVYIDARLCAGGRRASGAMRACGARSTRAGEPRGPRPSRVGVRGEWGSLAVWGSGE